MSGPQIGRIAIAMMLLLGVSVITAAAEPLPIKPPSQGLVQPVWGLTGNCKPIDFDSVKIEYDRPAGIYKLTIMGIKPHTNMEVSLAREEYARKPAFWWGAVVGCVKNFIVVPLATPYFLTVPLDPFVGTQGVEIVGASGSVRRKAPRS